MDAAGAVRDRRRVLAVKPGRWCGGVLRFSSQQLRAGPVWRDGGAALRQERALWAAAGIGAGATVVDLGCGPGAFLPAWSDHTGSTGTVVGVDAGPVGRPG
jgi:hypothetical protein